MHILLAPYSAEFDIDESTLGMSASRKPIDAGIVGLIAPFKPLKGLSLWFSKAVYRKQNKKLQW
ncbi:hypothetical protein [Pseudoalteromonas sp.]|uniref:hypothetical protein n=1 Tax=Pseudoalteromonas sp. TaxID=53249 RepID=UPI003F98D58A